MAARICKGDKVIVISGKDKGKTGEVVRVLVEDDKVVVKGVNVIKRHQRPTRTNQEGQIIEREAPIFACKVMPVDPNDEKKGTRVRFRKDSGTAAKVRIAAKSGAEIPVPSR